MEFKKGKTLKFKTDKLNADDSVHDLHQKSAATDDIVKQCPTLLEK